MSDDLIRRSAAIKAMQERYFLVHDFYTATAIIRSIPSADRPQGEWIDRSGGIEGAWNYCSVCGEQAIDLYDFCPNCGARMRPKLQGTHFDSIIIDECAMKGADDENVAVL